MSLIYDNNWINVKNEIKFAFVLEVYCTAPFASYFPTTYAPELIHHSKMSEAQTFWQHEKNYHYQCKADIFRNACIKQLLPHIYIQREHISILKLKWKFTRVLFIEARYLSFCKYISQRMLTLKLASASS